MPENILSVGPQWESTIIREGLSRHSLRTSVKEIGSPEERQENLHALAKRSFKYPNRPEKEDDNGFRDYAFTFHCTDSSIKAAGLDVKKSFTDEEMRKMCSEEGVLKIVLNNGWTATRDMWEIDKSHFVNGLIERFEGMGIPVVIINFDSNGWGESKITQEADETLKLGPFGGWVKGKGFADEDSMKTKWLKSRGDHVSNAIQPASVKRAANALHVALNDSLKVKGNVLMIGHSQGGKITRQYIHDEEERMTEAEYKKDSSKNILGYGLAAAESRYDLDDSIKSVFSVLKMLQVLPEGKMQATALMSGAEAVTSVFGLDNRLPREVRKALLSLHKSQMTEANLPMVIDQAFGWARRVYADNPDEIAPQNMVYLAGKNDRLIPFDNFQAWAGDRMAYRTNDISRIFSWSRPATQQFEGSHYFFFDERFTANILDQITGTARNTFFGESAAQIESIVEKIDAEVMTRPYDKLRFGLTTKKNLTTASLQDRIDTALELASGDGGSISRPQTARIVPVTFEEMTALYHKMMSLPNGKIKYMLGSDEGSAWDRVMASWDAAGMLTQERSGKQIVPDTLNETGLSIKNLVQLFPFDLYRQEGVSAEQITPLIENWIGPHVEILENVERRPGLTMLPKGATAILVREMSDIYRQLI